MGWRVEWRVGISVELWIRVGAILRMEWRVGIRRRCEVGVGAGIRSGSDGALGVWEFDLRFNSICGR